MPEPIHSYPHKGHAIGDGTFPLVQSSTFAGDGTIHRGVSRQRVHSVMFGEPGNQLTLLLPDVLPRSLGKVGGDAYVKSAVPPARQALLINWYSYFPGSLKFRLFILGEIWVRIN